MLLFTPLQPIDFPIVKEIYDHYIENSTATFHIEPITFPELEEMIPIGNDSYPSILISKDEKPIGYAYMSPFRKRKAYDISCEITLYFKAEFCGKGFANEVITYLEGKAKKIGIENIVATICSENEASIKLFEKFGYAKVAHYPSIGIKFGRKLDVVIYQKQL